MINKRGQLFLIEVIIALSVLVVLISTLFTIQSFSPPPDDHSLRQNGEAAIDSLVDSRLIFQYFEESNYSYYTLDERFFDPTNRTKLDVKHTVDGLLPAIANFKAFTDRYNSTSGEWEQIDSVNFEQWLPSGSDVTVVEYYTPGFNGNYVQFKFSLFMWYEVGS